MDLKQVTEYLELDTWHFAKTMRQFPHWYLVRDRMEEFKKGDWEAVVQFIRDNGVPEKFKGKTKPYLHLNGYKYWTMGAPLNETTIINRERIK